MSFNEFLQWLRRFFSSSRVETPRTPEPATPKPVEASAPERPAPSSPIEDSPAPATQPETEVESVNTNTDTPSSQPTTTQPSTPEQPEESITPTSAPETSAPATPTEEETASAPNSEIEDEATSPETPAPEPTSPSSVVDTPPVTPPEPVKPTIKEITTEDPKVALNREIVFQIHAEPAGKYEDCTLDLSGAEHATIVKDIDTESGQFSLSFNKASNTENDTQLIIVSNPQGDARMAVTVSLMKLFWHNHPGRKNVCDETLFVNQCAIRMGTALELSGIKMPEDRRILRRCTTEYRAFKHHKDGLVKGHVLAAQELANWIKSQQSTFGTRSIVHSQEEIMGRSGIIFFRDGWGSTDHIDVWDGQSLVGGFPSYFDSDFKELWFWDVY